MGEQEENAGFDDPQLKAHFDPTEAFTLRSTTISALEETNDST